MNRDIRAIVQIKKYSEFFNLLVVSISTFKVFVGGRGVDGLKLSTEWRRLLRVTVATQSASK